MAVSKQLKGTKSQINPPSVAFLACLLISILGWVVITVSKSYKITLYYRVNCYELPKNKSVENLSDSTIALTFNTRGLNYLNPKFSEKNRILNISIAELVKNKPRQSVYSISSKELNNYILTNNLIDPDFVGIENIGSWTVELK